MPTRQDVIELVEQYAEQRSTEAWDALVEAINEVIPEEDHG